MWADPDVALHPDALLHLATTLNQNPAIELIYTDEDAITCYGDRRNPFYKPDWSPDYFESCNYIGSTSFVEKTIASLALIEAESQYDLLLRVTERACKIYHLETVLFHRIFPLDTKHPCQSALNLDPWSASNVDPSFARG